MFAVIGLAALVSMLALGELSSTRQDRARLGAGGSLDSHLRETMPSYRMPLRARGR